MSLSLDIDYKSIVEWLTQRHKISSDWTKKLKAAKLKTQQLIELKDEIADEQIKKYITQHQENFTYQFIDQTMEKLKSSEQGQSKTFFGGYSNKTVSEWNALDKFYQKNNLHIVDIAKIISQNVQFEIPALKKNVETSENQTLQSQQKINDANNSIKQLEAEYEKQCRKLGLEGKDLQSEVPQMIKGLPQMYERISNQLQQKELQNSLDYYYNFTSYVNGKQEVKKIRLNTLEYMIKFGDDAIKVFEFRKNNHGQELSEQLQQLNKNKYLFYEQIGQQQQQVNNNEAMNIDWSSFQVTSTDQQQKQDQNSNEVKEINWGISVEAQQEEGQQQQVVQEINWGITTVQDDKPKESEVQEINWDVQIESSNNNAEEQISEEIPTILSNIETRNQLISELNELYYFYKHRGYEAKSHSTNSLLQIYDQSDSSQSLFDLSNEALSNYETLALNVLLCLTEYRFRHLLTIKEQPKSQERIINNLLQFKDNIKKQENNIQNLEKKIIQIQGSKQESQAKFADYCNQTVELKMLVEKLLSVAVKNQVKIIGDINKIKKL